LNNDVVPERGSRRRAEKASHNVGDIAIAAWCSFDFSSYNGMRGYGRLDGLEIELAGYSDDLIRFFVSSTNGKNKKCGPGNGRRYLKNYRGLYPIRIGSLSVSYWFLVQR